MTYEKRLLLSQIAFIAFGIFIAVIHTLDDNCLVDEDEFRMGFKGTIADNTVERYPKLEIHNTHGDLIEVWLPNSEIYENVAIGDSIVKFPNSYYCMVFRNDSALFCGDTVMLYRVSKDCRWDK